MASRAILRRKKSISNYFDINNNIRSIQSYSFSSFRQIEPSSTLLSNSSSSPSSPSYDNFSLSKKRLLTTSTQISYRHLLSGCGDGRSIYYYQQLGFRSIWHQSYRYKSTAAARAPEPESNEKDDLKEGVIKNQRKETSPEDCDQAVEGLSSAKAKAKAKQLLESQKLDKDKFLIKKLWAKILGIGPALKLVASMSREDWAIKLRHWKDEFVDTMKHYWLGLKLLWADVRISSRLMLKLAGGKSLSRRERQQLTRTTADIFRLVPVAVFLVVPFMEFLLPVFLKLFPNMLPSTFQDKMKEQEALKRRLKARIEYAKFLQETVKEMAKEVQISRSGEIKKTAEDLDDFLNKVRSGARVANEEILGFAKLFNDELTLDNISRPRLVNMCKYMGISPYGTDAYLRYMLRKRLQWIKNDDKMIQAEGVESLSETELRQACRERGIIGLLSVEEMRRQVS